jgi:hypothetical protein
VPGIVGRSRDIKRMDGRSAVMKLTPCLSGHIYITKQGNGVHLSPQDIRVLHEFIHREEKEKRQRVMTTLKSRSARRPRLDRGAVQVKYFHQSMLF